jgi:hypothetical protein
MFKERIKDKDERQEAEEGTCAHVLQDATLDMGNGFANLLKTAV